MMAEVQTCEERDASAAVAMRLTLLLFVDALRPDYLTRMPYLRSLASASATGALREAFGFVQHPAYFGGLGPEQYGFSSMYCYDPARSPFGIARWLPHNGARPRVEPQGGIRRLVDDHARSRVSPFAATYVSSLEIPLEFAPYFDAVEKRAPWDKRVGYRSLFALLDERGLPWYQCSWPESNRLSDHSDEGIVRRVLLDLKPAHRFAYVHLQELDGVGHCHGPNSAQLLEKLGATDRLCEQLIESLRSRYDQVDIVLFGDHGMVNVTRTLDVWAALNQTGLQFGQDYAFFLDSTMARFWFYHRGARAVVEQALRRLSGGRLLGDVDLKRYGLAGCDPRNGELIYLAHPGVLIFPNFFQGSGEPIKGMHGYDPDCPDNLGFFLVHSDARTDWAGRTFGRVDATALFPLVLSLLGIEPEGHTKVRQPVPARHGASAHRFTSYPEREADDMVSGQLRRITDAVKQREGEVEAVVLTGGFGRGEGGVFRDGDGRYRPVNDYDLIVVDSRDLRSGLAELGGALARELGIDFVDLGYSDGRWEKLPLTLFNYDLKYGSQVIDGDPAVLDRIPAYASADLPAGELVKLLLNRTAGVLSGLRGAFLKDQRPTEEQQRYLTNQVVKMLMAIGDWHLFRWQGYDSSYALRRQRLASLAPGAGIDPQFADRICRAYEFKCHPDYSRFAGGLQEIRELFPELNAALLESINLLTARHANDLAEAMSQYLAHQSSNERRVKADNSQCLAHPELRDLVQPNCDPSFSVRHLIYAVPPLVLAAVVPGSPAAAAFGQARRQLEPVFRLTAADDCNPDGWEQLRTFVVKAWFAVCH
ncbi:MAG TPA: alkaline phosphatase family protein [Verrucomicrobiae bacterium]|nr:alkaline phosphatase family protein [Verrucomicrobiae bacterium]